MSEYRTEQFSLANRRNARNKNDDSGVQSLLSMQSEKIRAIVGHECVFLLANDGHELPVLRTAETEIIHMICDVARRMREFNQGRVETFVDQEFHGQPSRVRAWREVRTGFRLAQGREGGRPRRGKAST